jgi:alpha-amylase
MKKAIVLYMHVHQPYRIRPYTIFDAGENHDYFWNDSKDTNQNTNPAVLAKVAFKSYLPTNKILLEMLNDHPEFKLSLSMSGTLLDQLQEWAPEVLASFQAIAATGRVEFVAETYNHSLAFFYSRSEFETQVKMHKEKIQELFGQTPTSLRNTELAYNNDLASWADAAGYKAIISEGWDPILEWRSPNFVYEPVDTSNIKLLMKNYKLSDDLAFRFWDRGWAGWPLTADKFCHWLSESGDATNFNLFMDYETFGEHQWESTGIFEFLRHLPGNWLEQDDHTFMTITEAAETFESKDKISMPSTVTWADTERDLSAWMGNSMQQQALKAIYDLEEPILDSGDLQLINDWRRLQTSDHFYYMCTKWFNDGDIHAYFSPYETPYEAVINFNNACHDLKFRLMETGVDL